MKQLDLNEIPVKVNSGEKSKQDAINELAVILEKNWCVFGLQRENPDIRSEILVMLLEKGYTILESYDSNYGSFFTYFFCYVKNLQLTCKRKAAIKNVREFQNVAEFITNYDSKLESYNSISYRDFEPHKVPYSYNRLSLNDFKVACNSSEYKILPLTKLKKTDENYKNLVSKLQKLRPKVAVKTLVVLAFKSAYYITDPQIEKICAICNLDVAAFQKSIQKLKNEIMDKQRNREKIIARRNHAYYLHKRFRDQLKWEDFDDFTKSKNKEKVIKNYSKHTKHWENLNKLLNKGTVYLRPTNKAVADELGICERQVSYYMKNAENLDITL